MTLLVREKKFYTSFFSLLLVISLQSLISYGVTVADNIMLGSYSELAMSGAAIANQIQFLLRMIVSGIASGVVVLGAQYWGKRDTGAITRIISLGFKLALFVGLVFFAVSFFFPEKALVLLTNDRAVIAEGARYMRVMSATNILFAATNTLIMSLRSVETAFIGTVTASITLVIKVALNYCLIFGRFGFPALGVTGAAVSTLVGWSTELVVVLVYLRFVDKKIKMTLSALFRFDWSFLRDYIRVCLPVVLSGAFWGVVMSAQTAILGHMSATAIGANSIASMVYQVTAVLAICSASASSVIIGKTIGENKMEKVRPYTVTLQVLFVAIGIVTAAALFSVRNAIVGVYNVSEETRELARTFMLILSITVLGTAYEFPVASGIIQGGGDTRYALIVEAVFALGFTLPLAALSAFVFNLPPAATFFFLKSDQLLKCIPNAIRCNRYKWVRQLTR